MSTTPKLSITEIAVGQSQKEVTANEAFRYLEQGAHHFIIKDRDLTSPPGSPSDGSAYIVGASATGDWSGQDNKVAFYLSTDWVFLTPEEGWLGTLQDENITVKYDGSAWTQAYSDYIKNNFNSTSIPTSTDDSNLGYTQGSRWVYNPGTTARESYICLDASTGSAVWELASLTIDDLGALAILNTVGTTSIDNAAITGIKIAAGAVSSSHIGSSEINSSNLANNSVTFAKIQDISSNTLLGRSSTGTGDPESIDFGDYSRNQINILAIQVFS